VDHALVLCRAECDEFDQLLYATGSRDVVLKRYQGLLDAGVLATDLEQAPLDFINEARDRLRLLHAGLADQL